MSTVTKDPSQEVAERMEALIRGLKRSKVSKIHIGRVLEYLEKQRKRYHTEPDAFPTDAWYRENAHQHDESSEVDSNALISRSDEEPEEGAYVQTWQWVAAPRCASCDEFLAKPGTGHCDKCLEEDGHE